MQIVSLASGSSGNCYLVQSNSNHNILIDCGLSASQVQKSLAKLGVRIAELSAVFLTHDHGDHLRGAGTISRKWGVPVYANPRTLTAARLRWDKIERLEAQRLVMFGQPAATAQVALNSATQTETADEIPLLEDSSLPSVIVNANSKYNLQTLPTGEVARFGNLEIASFPVSHDAADTVCYTIREDGRQATILTDLGCATEPIFEPLCHSDLIILEANHDVPRLKASRYPYSLKARITGDKGHLSNIQSAEILIKVIERSSPAHTVWLAHLSEQNNHPDVALREIGRMLEIQDIHKFRLQVALRDKPSLSWDGEAARYQMSMF